MIPSSLVDHPLFPELASFVKIETYARDGGHAHPRKRLELVTSKMPFAKVQEALEVEVKCCRCGRAIHPFRARHPKARDSRMELPRHIYLAVACDLDTNVACSRGRAARDQYIEIEKAVKRLTAWQRFGAVEAMPLSPDTVGVRLAGDLLPLVLTRDALVTMLGWLK